MKAIEKEPRGVIILIRTDPSGIFGATGGQVGWLIELSEYSVSDIGEFGVKFTSLNLKEIATPIAPHDPSGASEQKKWNSVSVAPNNI